MLSPLTKYYILKLFHEYLEERSWWGAATEAQAGISAKIETLEQTSTTELEALVQIYSRLEKNPTDNQIHLAEVKRRLFTLLGLHPHSFTPPQAIPVIQELTALKFCFLQGDKPQESLHHDRDFYGLVQSFALQHRFQAYQLAWALEAQNIPLVFTVSPTRYGVWVCLRSAAYTPLSHQGYPLLRMVLSIYSITHRFQKKLLRQTPSPVA